MLYIYIYIYTKLSVSPERKFIVEHFLKETLLLLTKLGNLIQISVLIFVPGRLILW